MVSAARQVPAGSALNERLRRAWYRHTVVRFVRHRQTITFYQQLHSLVRAGIALPSAFAQLTQFAPDEAMRRGLSSVAADVTGGATLGEALRKHSALFDDANVELLAFAEEAGRLEPVLAALVSHLERVQRQRWQAVMGALWPMYLAGGLTFIGPLFGIVGQVNAGHSLLGGYVVGLVGTLGTAVALVGSVLGFPFFIAALNVDVSWDRFKRSLPLVGAPMRTLAASRFVLGLGLASASGMEVMRSLHLAAKATASPSIEADVTKAAERVRTGSTLTAAVGALGVLPPSELGMLSVAETTGTIDETLERMSRELEDASARATRFLTIAVTGLVAAFLLLKIVGALLGTLMGPVKSMYDGMGSGKMPGVIDD